MADDGTLSTHFRLPHDLSELASHLATLKHKEPKLAPYNGDARAKARRRARLAELEAADRLPNPNTKDGQAHRNHRARQYAHWLARRDGQPVERDVRETSTTVVYGDPKERWGRPRFVRFFKPTTHRHGRPLEGALIAEIEIPNWDHVPIVTFEEVSGDAEGLV